MPTEWLKREEFQVQWLLCAEAKGRWCSSSDITVKRHKVQQHFWDPIQLPDWTRFKAGLTGREHIHPFCPVPGLRVWRAASSVKTCFSNSIPPHYKMSSALKTITRCLMCCKYKIIPSLDGSPRILQEIFVKIWFWYQEWNLSLKAESTNTFQSRFVKYRDLINDGHEGHPNNHISPAEYWVKYGCKQWYLYDKHLGGTEGHTACSYLDAHFSLDLERSIPLVKVFCGSEVFPSLADYSRVKRYLKSP